MWRHLTIFANSAMACNSPEHTETAVADTAARPVERQSELTLDFMDSRLTEKLAEHEGQDAAVAVVFDLDGRVDAGGDGHLLLCAVGAMDDEGQGLARGELVGQAKDIVGLGAVEFQGLGGGAFRELAG
jgi:hypothetical protein